MKDGWKWLIIGGLWMFIFYLGFEMFNRETIVIELPKQKEISNYDWEGILWYPFTCIGETSVEDTIPYTTISTILKDASQGVLTEVSIVKEDQLKIQFKLTTNQELLKKRIPKYETYQTWLQIIAGMPITITCLPDLEQMQFHISEVHVSQIALPDSLLKEVRLAEEYVQKIVKQIQPLEMIQYEWKSDGLYWKGTIPLQILRNSTAVFLHFKEK
ncbi:MAG: hypothetical protein PUF50_06085 [Erysipelotrichaceae bacterium]|nr:hypothetical protein [Erysipelotrichaceae bacterium]